MVMYIAITPTNKRLVSLAIWLIAFPLLLGCKPPDTNSQGGDFPPATKPSGPAVVLVIDFDDGLEKHYKLAADKPMTVLAVLDAASKRERGIRYETKGSGEMAMVLSIDGLANEGGGKGRNWIYWVNGQLAEKSCGVYEIQPNDVILWKFGTYE
jgi:hypothetical protein